MESYFQTHIIAAYAALFSFAYAADVQYENITEATNDIHLKNSKSNQTTENIQKDENNIPNMKHSPEIVDNIGNVSEHQWGDVMISRKILNKKDKKYKPKNANVSQSGKIIGPTKKQLRIAKMLEAKKNASQSEKKRTDEDSSDTESVKTIQQTRKYPELPKEYEEMIPTLNMTGLLVISMWINKYRETMNLFDDYADEVETETGLKLIGRAEFMNEFDDYIHRAQYLLKLRMYKLK